VNCEKYCTKCITITIANQKTVGGNLQFPEELSSLPNSLGIPISQFLDTAEIL